MLRYVCRETGPAAMNTETTDHWSTDDDDDDDDELLMSEHPDTSSLDSDVSSPKKPKVC